MAPRWPQDAPRRLQDGPKMASTCPGMPRDGSKMAPRLFQDALVCFKMVQDGPNMVQDGFILGVLGASWGSRRGETLILSSWVHLGGLGSILGHLGVSWAISGDLGAILELTWGHLGSISSFCEGGSGAKNGAPAEAKHHFHILAWGHLLTHSLKLARFPFPC